jgi:hypothetical protein
MYYSNGFGNEVTGFVLSIGKWNFWLEPLHFRNKTSITVYRIIQKTDVIAYVRVLSKPSSLRWESSLGLLVPFSDRCFRNLPWNLLTWLITLVLTDQVRGHFDVCG